MKDTWAWPCSCVWYRVHTLRTRGTWHAQQGPHGRSVSIVCHVTTAGVTPCSVMCTQFHPHVPSPDRPYVSMLQILTPELKRSGVSLTVTRLMGDMVGTLQSQSHESRDEHVCVHTHSHTLVLGSRPCGRQTSSVDTHLFRVLCKIQL